MATPDSHDGSEVLRFWFEEIDSSAWFRKDVAFDELLRERFGLLHQRAASCEFYTWRTTPQGRLAEIIVLDQFSRNIYRDTAAAFASDPLALVLAQEMVAAGLDQHLEASQRSFVYMPYMHSESLAIHDFAVELFRKSGSESSLKYEYSHRAIIERFGRYPHRNAILGRESTAEEFEFLAQDGSSF